MGGFNKIKLSLKHKFSPKNGNKCSVRLFLIIIFFIISSTKQEYLGQGIQGIQAGTFGSRYSRIDQVKFVEDRL